MENKKCLRCGKEFVPKAVNRLTEKKYCSRICQARFLANKQYELGTKAQPSKEVLTRSLKENYKNNKSKWMSRMITLQLFKDGKLSNLLNQCKLCNNQKDLQIHHEVYLTKKAQIIDAINEGKIYFVCRKCHGIKSRLPSDKTNGRYDYKALSKKEALLELLKKEEKVSTSKLANYISSNYWVTESLLNELLEERKVNKIIETTATYWTYWSNFVDSNSKEEDSNNNNSLVSPSSFLNQKEEVN